MNIYVGNLPPHITAQDSRGTFGFFGAVASVVVVTEKYPRTSRHAFVEMVSKAEGAAAISVVRAKGFDSLPIDVVEALPLSNRKASSAHRLASPEAR